MRSSLLVLRRCYSREVSPVYTPLPKNTEYLRSVLSTTPIPVAASTAWYFDAIDNVGANVATRREISRIPNVSYRSQAHRSLFANLNLAAIMLHNERYFEDKNGSASFMLLGSRGIGKSLALKSFTDLSAVVYPNLLPVYVTCDGVVDRPDHPMRRASLVQNVAKELREVHGIKLPMSGSDMMVDLTDALCEADKWLFLMIDELEQLYQTSSTKATETLAELATLGDQDTGRFCTVLCGSSITLPLLITKNLSPRLQKEYPLFHHSPDLNETKFETRQVGQVLPTNLELAGIIYKTRNKDVSDEDLLRMRRLATFLCGSSAHKLETLYSKVFDLGRMNLEATTNTLTSAYLRELFVGIKAELLERNRELFTSLEDSDGYISATKVVSVPWEERFAYLNIADVDEIWKQISPDVRGEELVDDAIYHLVDRSYLCANGVSMGRVRDIGPSSLMQLLLKDNQKSEKVSFKSFLDFFARKHLLQ